MFRNPILPFLVAGLSASFLGGCEKTDESPEATSVSVSPAETQQTAQPPKDVASPMMVNMRASCPMVVPNAKVEVEDTEDGIALTFTTDSQEVDDLRKRVESMAGMYEMHRGHGSMMWHHMREGASGMGMHGKGRGHMAMSGPMPSAKATVENIDNGARLLLTPQNSEELGKLREHVRAHQQRMGSGECWMLQNEPAGG